MSSAIGFTIDDIKDYLIFSGGKIDYHELIRHFKSALSDPNTQTEARSIFKDYVNTLAAVATENNKKYLILRPQFMTGVRSSVAYDAIDRSSGDPNAIGLPIPEKRRSQSFNYRNMPIECPSPFPCESISAKPMASSVSPVCDNPPQPPPRRRSSTGGTKVKLEERLKQFHDDSSYDKENHNASPLQHHDKLKEIHELTSKTPGRVKERAQKINKMASESELKAPMPLNNNGFARVNAVKTRANRDDDTDSGSVQTLDPLRKKWIITASSCDYNELLSLLKEEPKLAAYKDFTSGYTALHWAAKFGNANVIKLIAGSCEVNPNIKSHGGYTPLHLAALHKHEQIMDLLINTYHADSNIRDHSGKRPAQYLNMAREKQQKRDTNASNSVHQQPSSESSSSFIRIGSLKAASRMRKTFSSFGGKNWGSADSINENNIITPSKYNSNKKSKKNKKSLSLYSAFNTENTLHKDSDSDSAYGFPAQ